MDIEEIKRKHAVCGWRGEKIVLITVHSKTEEPDRYIEMPAKAFA